MSERNCLVLSQYREGTTYNDFVGKFYHFPQSYLNQFEDLPIEFIYHEPQKRKEGKGEFFGYGKIVKPPFEDKREKGFYFVEIEEYNEFAAPISYKDSEGNIIEEVRNPHYNSGNSVRKVPSDLLDEICLDGKVLLNFQADAHLVQILGEQLIASERVGILELVKNGFDAGASLCSVRIEKVPGLTDVPQDLYSFNQYDGPVIVIEDDGKGMSKTDIEYGWLRPASTIKTNIKDRIREERAQAVQSGKKKAFEKFLKLLKIEHKGRVPLGEKGVGRFACHRLGSKLTIKTKIAEKDYEYVLNIDWDDFNPVRKEYKNLNSVGISLTRQSPSRDYGETNSGTQIIIYGGREGFELDEDEIHEINRTILKLNTPNPNPSVQLSPFSAKFECLQVKNLDKKIDYKKYSPVFSISGIVDEFGVFNYDYKFTPPYHEKIPLAPIIHENKILDLKVLNKDFWFEEVNNQKLWRIPNCGSFYVHIDIWYRDKPWKDNLDNDFLSFLKKYGGISVYRDGINVFSAEWGAESDWLELRQRQIQQAKRLSYYHMIGNVEIEQGENISITDKTNREGMIGNRAFKDLKELVKGVTFLVEKDYMGKRDELNRLTGGLIRDTKVVKKFSTESAQIITNIHDKYDLTKDPYQLLTNLGTLSERKSHLVDLSKSLKNLEKNLGQIQEVQELLTEQAGFGLGIAVALHEISKTTSNFYYGILEVIESGDFDTNKLDELKETSKSLESELKRLSPLRALRNEEPIAFKISKSIDYVYSMFKRRFEKLDISFSYNVSQDFKVVARYGAVNQILTNLFENSCYWMDNPKILSREIKLEMDSSHRTLIVADNGPGIDESVLPYLFTPGYSLKYPPSGLGLYVCKHYLNLMKKRGDIYLVREGDRLSGLNGAQFLLDFSKVSNPEND
ncbi:ATP-binding protein [Maribacter sp. 2304DJ31-5]|uniref:ATP-binding protein n=1 Tax=Maribacter sp. 2304DJ31-5 TaxID=3386273 RepID=UPI0039BCB728